LAIADRTRIGVKSSVWSDQSGMTGSIESALVCSISRGWKSNQPVEEE